MTSALDQKRLADVQREFDIDPPGLVEHIIRAYLSTVIPAEIAGVVEELRERARTRNIGTNIMPNDCTTMGYYGPGTAHRDEQIATLIERLAASQASLEEALAESDRNAEKLEALLDPHIAWEGRPSASQVETRRLALEEAAAHLKRQPSFGDGKWAAAHVRALIDQPSTEGGKDG